MAAEALTPVVLERECERRQFVERGLLAAAFGVKATVLDAEVRRRIIFQGDEETYTEARRASDGFEHGFIAFDELHALARRRRDIAAKYVREAILELSGLPLPARNELITGKRAKPLGCWPVVQYMWGTLVGEGERLSAAAEKYPHFALRSRMKSVVVRPDGARDLRPESSLTLHTAPGIGFRAGRYEAWAP